MTPAPKSTVLASFVPNTGAYRIAEALLDADDWMTRSELADIGRVARTAVPNVARRLRFECGVDVHVRRTLRGEAQYRVGDKREQRPPLHAVADGAAA